MYLSFFFFFEEFISLIPFFYGRAVFCWICGKAPVIFCPRFFPLFPGVSVTVSTHLIAPTAVPKLDSFHERGTREFFAIRSEHPLTATSVLKTRFFIADEKVTTSGAKASANNLAHSPPPSHPVMLLNDLYF